MTVYIMLLPSSDYSRVILSSVYAGIIFARYYYRSNGYTFLFFTYKEGNDIYMLVPEGVVDIFPEILVEAVMDIGNGELQ